MQRRQIKLLAADAVHLFPQNLHDPQSDALPERQVRIDARGKLAHDSRAQQKLVRSDLGVSRILAKCRNKVLGPAHSETFSLSNQTNATEQCSGWCPVMISCPSSG